MIQLKLENHESITCDFCDTSVNDKYNISSEKDIEIDICEKCLLQLTGLAGIVLERRAMERMIKLGLIDHGM